MKFMKWLGELIAQHTLLQIVAAASLAYFAGVTTEIHKGAGAVFDALPPLFWPIFAALVLAATIYPGFIAPIRRGCQEKTQRTKELLDEKKEQKRVLLEQTYWAVTHAHEPQILDKSNPDRENQSKLFAIAVSRSDVFISQWKENEGMPPQLEDEDGLVRWHVYLRGLKSQP